MEFILRPGQLQFADLLNLLNEQTTIQLASESHAAIHASWQVVKDIVAQNKIVYGINTGFGALANTKIDNQDLGMLQKRLVLSHAAGTGELLDTQTVRLILALKINSLARGYSGVRLQTIETLINFYNAGIYPCIPVQGSVGASGDLAPLAHLSAALIGVGDVEYQGRISSAHDALRTLGIPLLELAPKEGLALLNGTQVSTALALINLFKAENIFRAAITVGALSVDAARGSDTPFAENIQAIRGHAGQIKVAAMLQQLLQTSAIRESHLACNKIQDPYSLRCQPQVMGACLTQLNYAKDILLIEANAVSDNPVVFADDHAVVSGGNFHAEPVAFAADAMAVALAEIGALSERRIALLIDPNLSNLPAFLVKNAGLNSGFMLPQVTAASLTSENKSLAHPASVDSIPTSANQEDHVSMATFAARRLEKIIQNVEGILAIEFLAASQGIDFLRPLTTSTVLEGIHATIREVIPHYDQDRYFAPDIAEARGLLRAGKLCADTLPTLFS